MRPWSNAFQGLLLSPVFHGLLLFYCHTASRPMKMVFTSTYNLMASSSTLHVRDNKSMDMFQSVWLTVGTWGRWQHGLLFQNLVVKWLCNILKHVWQWSGMWQPWMYYTVRTGCWIKDGGPFQFFDLEFLPFYMQVLRQNFLYKCCTLFENAHLLYYLCIFTVYDEAPGWVITYYSLVS